MLNTRSHNVAGAPNNSMNRVTLGEEQFGQVRTVLAGDSRDQCSAHDKLRSG
jgi:hypothetical protein